MTLGIIVPLWLNDCPTLWESTRRAVGSHDYAARLYLVPNRLAVDAETLRREMQPRARGPVDVLPVDTTRSVAGAWNAGIRRAAADGCERFLITANDCYWHPGSIARLVDYGGDALAWSGRTPGGDVVCDFSGVMLRPETIGAVGWFDELFRPAYFEDNDYALRVVKYGGTVTAVPGATFDHAGSLTLREDPEAAHHVRHWFESNRARFIAKWGGPPPHTSEECNARYDRPWNNPDYSLGHW